MSYDGRETNSKLRPRANNIKQQPQKDNKTKNKNNYPKGKIESAHETYSVYKNG